MVSTRVFHRDIWVYIVLLLLGVSFYLTDKQIVPVGDDLGYMFTDSVHHLGDGHRVHSTKDITSTLISHYKTTNGRFLVHWIAMFFLNIGGKDCFCFFNTLLFLLTVIFFSRLAINQARVSGGMLVSLALLLWIAIPMPGTTWLGLICYSTNYLWTAGATLIFLWYFIKISNTIELKKSLFSKIVIILGSVIAGSLQESFTLPVSAGLLIAWIINRKKFRGLPGLMTISYWVGTAICVLAPGNLGHLSQGGGLGMSSFVHKILALLNTLLTECPILIFALIAVMLALIFYRNEAKKVIKENIILVTALMVSLLLALLTFTAARQLTFPMILTAILIVRFYIQCVGQAKTERELDRFGLPLGLCVYIAVSAWVWIIRVDTHRRYAKLHEDAIKGQEYLIFDLTDRHPERLMERFDFGQLPVIFDGYTKRGLSRLYTEDPNTVKTIMPAPIPYINRGAEHSKIGDGVINTSGLMEGYRCFFIPKGKSVYKLRDSAGRTVSFERIKTEEGVLVVVPNVPETIVMSYSDSR